MEPTLPSFAPFPAPAILRDVVGRAEWTVCLESWFALTGAHLSLRDSEFAEISMKDDSMLQFLVSFLHSLGSSESALLDGESAVKPLKTACYFLTRRALQQHLPIHDSSLIKWEVFADFCHAYGKRRAGKALQKLPRHATDLLGSSLSGLKKCLVKKLDSGMLGDLKAVETCLHRVNYLVSAWPGAAALFLAGSDYIDALITGFRVAGLPLRTYIVTNVYLCLTGLTESSMPKYSQLIDALYSMLGTAIEQNKSSHNVNDSFLGELVTATPVLQQLQQRAEAASTSNVRMISVLNELAKFRGPGGAGLRIPQKRHIRSKLNKGKARASGDPGERAGQLLVHRLSQITQIQDLFPDLGSAFVAKLLDEYGENSEQVVSHLLEDTLPRNLANADRSENLPSNQPGESRHADLAPRPTPPLVPSQKNAFADDSLVSLAAEIPNLHFGKQRLRRTADDILRERLKAPNKAAILSALAAFDTDDDERDDTYDAADVGGTVDNFAATGTDDLEDAKDEALFAAYQTTPTVFGRDAATRRGETRMRLRDETGMTDEAIEGWGLMFARNPQRRRRLEAKFNSVSGAQTELARTSWRAHGEEDGRAPEQDGTASSRGGTNRGGRGYARGGGGRGSRGGGGGGSVAGPSGEKETEQARRRKEASKSSRANHNRRDQRARKMARGGFPG